MTNAMKKRILDAFMALWAAVLILGTAFGYVAARDHEESDAGASSGILCKNSLPGAPEGGRHVLSRMDRA